MRSEYVDAHGVKIHCLVAGDGPETVVLSHGLTANAHSFAGYIEAGLSERYRVVLIDLRGRGLSDQPEDYSMEAHMRDLIAVLDHFELDQAIIGGHSFGALLSIYTSYHHPDRFRAMILIDAAARLHPDARDLVGPAIERLGQIWPNRTAFIEEMRQSVYLGGAWDAALESYFDADIRDLEDYSVTPRSQKHHIIEAVTKSLGIGEQWLEYITGATCPTLLINGPDAYVDDKALLPMELALETVDLLYDGYYAAVSGNHMTMMFGEGAQESVVAIDRFISSLT